MKNLQLILSFVTSSLIAIGVANGFIQEHVHFAGVANEMAVFALSGGFALICAGILLSDAFKNVRNFFKK